MNYLNSFETIPELITYVLNRYSNSKALNMKYFGQWEHYSTDTFSETIRRLALGLRKMGVKPGDGIGIISKSSPQWLMFDIAVMINKAVSIPMFHTISAEHFEYQIKDSAIQYIFIEGETKLKEHIQNSFKQFKKVISYSVQTQGPNVINFHDILLAGDELSHKEPDLFARMRDAVEPDDCATIIYTSGSTGEPKGVALSHKNLIMQIRGCAERFPIHSHSDTILSCLPLAHVFERMVMYYYLSTGTSIYFVDNIQKLSAYLKEVKPTVITMVPRLLEKIYATIMAKAAAHYGLKSMAFSMGLKLASKPQVNKSSLSYTLCNTIIFSKIRDSLGGNLRMTIVGGAALIPTINRFFENIGIPVYQGYGLTECSPVLASNFPGHNKLGTVGLPFPGVEIKISDEGEVLAKGANVMMGYHNKESQTQAIMHDGWLHTGDLGAFDSQGYLIIKGRVKELMKTSTGKYVSQLAIEHRISLTKTIDALVVIADNKPFVTCLIFPDFDIIPEVKRKEKLDHLSNTDFIHTSLYRDHIQHTIDRINKTVNEWEVIRAFTIIDHRLSIEGGDLTPTMKIRRHVIYEKYKADIDAMYEGPISV